MELSQELVKEIGKKHWEKMQQENILLDGENILAVIKGTAESSMMGEKLIRECRLLLLDTRLVVYMPKMLGRYELEEFSYNQLTSVKKHKGLAFGEIQFSVAGNWQKIGMLDKKKIDGIHNILQAQIQKASAPQVIVQTIGNTNFCGECGTPLIAGMKFCSNCGTKVH